MTTKSKEKDTKLNVLSPYPNNRVGFIDVARGLLIILVVLGHSPFLYSKFLYWFHMPAFFILSGMLHRQPERLSMFLQKRTFALLIPYVAYGLLVWLVGYSLTVGDWAPGNVVLALVRFAYSLLFWGGAALNGNMAVFWFINCFLLTIIAFTLAKYWLRRDALVMGLAALGYGVAYVLNLYLDRETTLKGLPWEVNVVPYAFAYFVVGYYAKGVIKKVSLVPAYWLALPLALCATLVYLGLSGAFAFNLNMKYGDISHPVLGFLVPLLFTLLVLMISAKIRHPKSKAPLAYIGRNTLPIMYLHIVVNFLLHTITGVAPAPYLFLLTGLSIPLLLTLLFRKYKLTSMLFLGDNSKGLLNLIPLKHKIRE